jgi:hypothetical protein
MMKGLIKSNGQVKKRRDWKYSKKLKEGRNWEGRR